MRQKGIKDYYTIVCNIIRYILIEPLHRLGFLNMHRAFIHGPKNRLHLGKHVGRGNNALYNTRSGHIYIGDDTVISFNCMFLTGRHEFMFGKLKMPKECQVPQDGYDIHIGRGCWIASGAIITGGVSIGDNCIVAAGAVVTKSFASGTILGGVPAKVLGHVDNIKERID
jgi:acetyltransferase-like isoleucine patch superfamily enzyme